jgi:hypothetical protein
VKEEGATLRPQAKDGSSSSAASSGLSFSGQFKVKASRMLAPVVNPFINETIAITGYEWFKVRPTFFIIYLLFY